MKDLRCLIVDDEPLAIDIVANYLQRLDIQSVVTSANGIDAFRQLQQGSFDLLFLDIEMPQLTGFDLLKSLPDRPLVVITTAYRDYAVEGFEWAVLDYLVKPFSFARFLQTMEKATRAIQVPPPAPSTATPFPRPAIILPLPSPATAQPYTSATNSQPAPDPATPPPDDKNFLFLKTDRHWVKVEIAAILYIESLKDYIRVFTATGNFLCHLSLTDITSRLPPEKFCRVHRSYTIALARIDQVRHHCAHIGATAIPIARAHRQEIYRRLSQ